MTRASRKLPMVTTSRYVNFTRIVEVSSEDIYCNDLGNEYIVPRAGTETNSSESERSLREDQAGTALLGDRHRGCTE